MTISTHAGSRKARRKEERKAKKRRLPTEPDLEDQVDTIEAAHKKKKSKQPKRKHSKNLREAQHQHEGVAEAPPQPSDPYSTLDPEVAAALRNDDAEIAELEAKLGLSGSKDKRRLNKEYARLEGYGDDFGDFLDDLDDIMAGGISKGLANSDGDDYDDGDDDHYNDDNELMYEDSSDDEPEELVPMKSPAVSEAEDEEVLEQADDMDESNRNEESEDDAESSDDSEVSPTEQDDRDHDTKLTYKPVQGEDIYGNAIENTQKKYVPPHQRKQQEQQQSQSANLRVIKRSLNNLFNRLSGDTLISVAQSIAELYSSNPAADVNECVWSIVMTTCISRPTLMTGMAPVFIGCLAGVHVQTSDTVQIGGHMLEQTVSSLWKVLQQERGRSSNDGDDDSTLRNDKEASNLVLTLCYLYNFGIAHSSLIYDVVRDFIKHFTEMDVELVLIILSHSGHSLRSDDPSSLKEIVLTVQERAMQSTIDGKATSSRVDYMVSAMVDLKNNKRRKQDLVFAEKAGKLRKLIGRIKSTVASRGSSSARSSDSCLRVRLDDILNVETKGRWWRVGASWMGNQFKDGEPANVSVPSSEARAKAQQQQKAEEEEDELLRLASKQRMNTDTRRSIFCIIMGSDDCNDAFEKLVRAGMLKNRYERDAVRVLMECCGNEKAYNPYYAHLASRIIEYQSQCKFSFQLAYWDMFKQFDEQQQRKVANLAKLLCHLVAKHRSLKLTTLKVIDMAPDMMSENAMIFLTIFFSSVLDLLETPEQVSDLFEWGLPLTTAAANATHDDDAAQESLMDDDDGLRESLSVFFLHTLKASPKNKKKSKFRAKFKAAVKACQVDELDSMMMPMS